MGGTQARLYRPEHFTEGKSEREYEEWRKSREHPYVKQVKKNYSFYVRAAFAERDNYMYGFLRRVDAVAAHENISFKGRMTRSHYFEMKGYFKNPYEKLLGEMDGTLVPVTVGLHLPANDYGDRPVYMKELDKDDKRIFGDSTYFHEHLDKTNTKKHACKT